jgi:hypothetical protein
MFWGPSKEEEPQQLVIEFVSHFVQYLTAQKYVENQTSPRIAGDSLCGDPRGSSTRVCVCSGLLLCIILCGATFCSLPELGPVPISRDKL